MKTEKEIREVLKEKQQELDGLDEDNSWYHVIEGDIASLEWVLD